MHDFSDIKFSPGPQPRPAAASAAPPAVHAATGTILKATIIAEHWELPGQSEELYCGSFEVSGIRLQGPPSTANIEAVSVPMQHPIRREKHTQGWEDTTLRAIASDMAGRGGLSLYYEFDRDPLIDRTDQRQEADLPFLLRLAKSHGASVKVSDGKLIVFSEVQREKAGSALTIRRGDNKLLAYSFTQDSSDVASSATAIMKDPVSGQLAKATFTPPEAPAVNIELIENTKPPAMHLGRGSELPIAPLVGFAGHEAAAMPHQKQNMPITPLMPDAGGGGAASTGDGTPRVISDFSDIKASFIPGAEIRAQTALREKNKNEWTCDITIMGDTSVVAGTIFETEGFGVFDKKWMAYSVTHTVGGGYTTKIQGKKVLGY